VHAHRRKGGSTSANKAARDFSEMLRALGLLKSKFPPFETWEELREAQRQSGLEASHEPDSCLPIELAISLECLKIFQSYTSSCVTLLLPALLSQGTRKNPKLQASFTLLSGITTDIGAIEVLSRSGFDIQAKIIVRALREKLDALIAVQLDRGFAIGFVESGDSEDSNRFWHQRVARGKLLKNIAKRLGHYTQDGQSPIDDFWLAERKRLDLWLGASVHPSHTTGLLSAFPRFGEEGSSLSDSDGLWGQPSSLSIPTISAVIGLAFEVTLLVHMRKLIPARDQISIVADSDAVCFLQDYLGKAEKFLMHCTWYSQIEPSLDYHRLALYLSGYMLTPLEEDADPSGYQHEMLKILSTVLDEAIVKLENKAANQPI
jgi:hypothetical protein